MWKVALILLSIIIFSIQIFAQWTDFPAGYSAVPKSDLKGAVRTVLTIEQRGEYVFRTSVNTFDKKGRLIEALKSNANIEVHSQSLVRLGGKETFFYDSNGRLEKAKSFAPEGQFESYTNYIYNSKNFLSERIIYRANGTEALKTTYTYFPDKQQVEVKWLTEKILLSYNTKNQWTKRIRSGDSRSVDFEYDNSGNIVRESYGSYWHSYTYKFDSIGNWIEQENTYTQYGKDGKEEVSPGWMTTYRIITYYSDSDLDSK
jgi:CRISPR/Cas system CMR-associated protein Cmr5 small subunit